MPARSARNSSKPPPRRSLGAAEDRLEIKGYRHEDAKEKKSTIETYWVPGVNNLKKYGRWAFAEFREIYAIEADFKARVETKFNSMIAQKTAARAGL